MDPQQVPRFPPQQYVDQDVAKRGLSASYDPSIQSGPHRPLLNQVSFDSAVRYVVPPQAQQQQPPQPGGPPAQLRRLDSRPQLVPPTPGQQQPLTRPPASAPPIRQPQPGQPLPRYVRPPPPSQSVGSPQSGPPLRFPNPNQPLLNRPPLPPQQHPQNIAPPYPRPPSGPRAMIRNDSLAEGDKRLPLAGPSIPSTQQQPQQYRPQTMENKMAEDGTRQQPPQQRPPTMENKIPEDGGKQQTPQQRLQSAPPPQQGLSQQSQQQRPFSSIAEVKGGSVSSGSGSAPGSRPVSAKSNESSTDNADKPGPLPSRAASAMSAKSNEASSDGAKTDVFNIEERTGPPSRVISALTERQKSIESPERIPQSARPNLAPQSRPISAVSQMSDDSDKMSEVDYPRGSTRPSTAIGDRKKSAEPTKVGSETPSERPQTSTISQEPPHTPQRSSPEKQRPPSSRPVTALEDVGKLFEEQSRPETRSGRNVTTSEVLRTPMRVPSAQTPQMPETPKRPESGSSGGRPGSGRSERTMSGSPQRQSPQRQQTPQQQSQQPSSASPRQASAKLNEASIKGYDEGQSRPVSAVKSLETRNRDTAPESPACNKPRQPVVTVCDKPEEIPSAPVTEATKRPPTGRGREKARYQSRDIAVGNVKQCRRKADPMNYLTN